MHCKLLLLLVLSSFIFEVLSVTALGKEAIANGKIHSKHDKKKIHHQQHGGKHHGTSHHQSATKTHSHAKQHAHHHALNKKTSHHAKAKATTHHHLQATIAEANQILHKHRHHDQQLVEILGHVWNSAPRTDRVAMLTLLSDHSLQPDEAALNFRYRSTDEDAPSHVLLEASARKQSALAYSSLLSKVGDSSQRSHVIEKTLWHSLTPVTQAKVYDMFDLSDQAGALTTDCPSGQVADSNNHCYTAPNPHCSSPLAQFGNICGTPCSSDQTCVSHHCVGGKYCDSEHPAGGGSSGGAGGHPSAANQVVFSMSAVLLAVLMAVYLY